MDDFVSFSHLIMSEHIFTCVSLVVLFFLLQGLLCYRQIYSLFDPLVYFMVFSSFSLTLVYFVSLTEGNWIYFVESFLFLASFLFASVFYKKINFQLYELSFRKMLNNEYYWVYVLFSLIFICSTLLLWIVNGVPVLSENPTDSKVLLYQNGFGVVRYIHFILPIFILLYSLIFLFSRVRGKIKNTFTKVMILFSILFFISSGAKSALIPVIFVVVFLSMIFFSEKSQRKVRFFSVILLCFAFVYALCVFYLSIKSGGNVENIPISLVQSVFIRLLASGDVFFFWYKYDLEWLFKDNNIFVYLFTPLLSILRVIPHDFPLGAKILHFSTGFPLSSFGPNSQLLVVFSIYFGVFKFVMAFLFGLIVFYFRNMSYRYIFKFGFSGFMFFSVVNFSVFDAYFDVQYVLSKIFVLFILFIPVCLLVDLLRKVKVKG